MAFQGSGRPRQAVDCCLAIGCVEAREGVSEGREGQRIINNQDQPDYSTEGIV